MKLEDQAKAFESRLEQKLYKAGKVVENRMHELVARKTGELDESIKTDTPIVTQNEIEVKIGSEGVRYAIFVELGVLGREYNYHRDGSVVYTGVGQRWAERALLESIPEINRILSS